MTLICKVLAYGRGAAMVLGLLATLGMAEPEDAPMPETTMPSPVQGVAPKILPEQGRRAVAEPNATTPRGGVPESVALPSEAAPETETVTERFPNGEIRVERQVALDSEGNYVNHGTYNERDAQGNVVRVGEFRQGKLHGHWIRLFNLGEGSLFAGQFESQFVGPFVSEATFVDGKLNGAWTIRGKDQQPIIEWAFENGMRHGRAVWYYPGGMKRRELSYDRGKPVGQMVEWEPNGSPQASVTFLNGRALVRKTEWFEPGKKAFEGDYLVGMAVAEPTFDWWNGLQSEAAPDAPAPELKHGVWTSWHPNGQKKAQGEYREDVPVGKFVWWFENGQKQAEGHYTDGLQSGAWFTWHLNGQKESRGDYSRGSLVGKWMRWTPEGKLTEVHDFERAPRDLPAPALRSPQKAASHSIMGPSL